MDTGRSIVALANFYAPMNDGRVDELTFKIMNVHIGAREDPQPLMLKLQAYREELFAASGCERDEARLTADLNNSRLGDEHSVALIIYHQNPLMHLTAPLTELRPAVLVAISLQPAAYCRSTAELACCSASLHRARETTFTERSPRTIPRSRWWAWRRTRRSRRRPWRP